MKKAIFLTTAIAAMAVSAPAAATVYSYNTTLGSGIGDAVLTIDTAKGTARYKGSNINVTLSSSGLRNFKGDLSKVSVFKANSISGTIRKHGRTFHARTSRWPKTTQVHIGAGGNFLWTYAFDKHGRGIDFDGKGPISSTSTGGSTGSTSTGGSTGSTSTGGSTSSTSTGGSTSSSTGGSTSSGGASSSSSGGTPVPAPGVFALFGLGAGALAFRSRRNRKKQASKA